MILYLFNLIVFIYLFMCLFVQLVREVIICRHIYLFIYLCSIISQFFLFCMYFFYNYLDLLLQNVCCVISCQAVILLIYARSIEHI